MASPSRFREPPKIFLSYAREDEDVADSLRSALANEGASVWTPEQLNLSAQTPAGIREAIKRSDLFLLIVTPASLKSAWVEAELQLALGLNDVGEVTKVVPVVVGDTPVPPALDRLYSLVVETSDWQRVARHLLAVSPRVKQESEADFSEQIRKILDELGLVWSREPVLGGVRPDFVLRSPDNRTAVLEVKAHDSPSLYEALRARTQATRFMEALGTDAAFVVFRSLSERLEDEPIVDAATLREALLDWLGEVKTSREDNPSEAREGGGQGIIFVAMPFSAEYSDVYWVASRGAAEALGLGCVRIDEADYTGDVTEKIRTLIGESVAVIADVSEARANVMYETGFAHALQRPCVHLCSTPLDGLPFDIRNWNTMSYEKGETWKLRERLEERLRGVLQL